VTEGENADLPRIGRLARDDAVTCGLDARAEEILPLIEASPYGFALVLAADRTLLGRLRRSVIKKAGGGSAEALMSPGPSTVRPDLTVDELRERLDEKDLKTAIVSTPEGRLIGVVPRSDL
jgi:CBS domain-containing protein